MRHVYLDHNATTPVLPEVLEAMLPYQREVFGNPSSVHHFGRRARVAIDDARDAVADMLRVPASTVIFSSGGTEANNTIIKGVAQARRDHGRHLITTQIEHPAVLDTCAALEQRGYEITYLPVDEQGVVDPEAVRDSLTDETILVSVMLANNEVGSLQPIAEITAAAHERGVLMHTDAVQAFGKVPLSVDDLGVDFLSFSGHKIYAPKGVGGWYERSAATLQPLLHGGHQERGRRSGTENVPGIAALGKACLIVGGDLTAECERQRQLQERLEHVIRERIGDVRIQGEDAARLPGTTNASFAGTEGEALMMSLDLQGVAISTGSACSSGSLEPSHVLRAMRVPRPYLHGALRFSLGRSTTADDVDYVLQVLPDIVSQARNA